MLKRAWALLLVVLVVPTMLAADREVRLFNGTDLKGWKLRGGDKAKEKSKWVVGRASLDPKDPKKLAVTVVPPSADGGPGARELINAASGVDLYTEQEFADCTVELELMVPKGSNSGVYLMGEYEVQILDSYGKEKVGPGDLGGIYNTSAPKVNAAAKPGEWQSMIIEFQAPRFTEGKKTSEAKFIKVTLNGKVIQQDVAVKGPTPACLTGKEKPRGPLMFQGDHGPVALRNLVIRPKEDEK
jgi:hypothetical protein